MASIMDKRKSNRLITLSRLDYTAGDVTTIPDKSDYPIRVPLEKGNADEFYFMHKEYSLTNSDDSVYHLPFIFNECGTPWYEANLYFYERSMEEDFSRGGYKTTDEIRIDASMLLDYKLFCEDECIDYLDFSASRAAKRPSYRYSQYLLHRDDVSPKNLNKRTLVVYKFYEFISKLPGYSLDMTRVDKTKQAFIIFQNGFKKQVTLRSQTVNASYQQKPVPIGYVRDGGEDLRPLSNGQCDELIDVLNSGVFSVDERLIHLIALNTGCRKQSIFTMRMKHINQLFKSLEVAEGLESLHNISQELKDEISADGTLVLKAGGKTGIDTKNGKPQKLHFPRSLVRQIHTYAFSKESAKRRKLFEQQYGDILSEDDMYLFLSTNGNCHYMAKNDPRYRQVKTRPKGEHTDYLKEKLFRNVSASFPKSFTFHWQRATFAYQYYQHLSRLVVYNGKTKLKPGQLRPGDEIRKIQIRLHHTNRETTEHYLKLFVEFDDKLVAQDGYEEILFKGIF